MCLNKTNIDNKEYPFLDLRIHINLKMVNLILKFTMKAMIFHCPLLTIRFETVSPLVSIIWCLCTTNGSICNKVSDFNDRNFYIRNYYIEVFDIKFTFFSTDTRSSFSNTYVLAND